MRTAKAQALIDYLEAEIKREENQPNLKCYLPYLELMTEYFRKATTAREEGKYLAGHTIMTPPEVFYAMDIVPIHVESYCLFLNFFEDLMSYLDGAAEHGFPPEVCSVHRVADVMCMMEDFPKPDFFVYSSQVCDNTPKGGEGMAKLYNVPGYLLDHPYLNNERSLNYYTEELEGLVQFLEEHTGKKMDYDRLKEVVNLSAQMSQLSVEISQIRKAIPEPMPSKAIFAQLAMSWLLSGLPDGLPIMRQLRDEIKERAEKGIGDLPEERHRLLYTFSLPLWDMAAIDWMEEEYKSSIVLVDIDEAWLGNGEWLFDPKKPLENIARKSFVHPITYQLHGPMENWVQDIVKNAQEYKVDGAIYFAHIGCRQGCATIRAIKEELQKLDVPMVVIDGDFVDKSITSPGEVRNKLDGFFEILEGRE